jgi:hypothetical protein
MNVMPHSGLLGAEMRLKFPIPETGIDVYVTMDIFGLGAVVIDTQSV